MFVNKKNPRLKDRLIINFIILIVFFAVSFFTDFEYKTLNLIAAVLLGGLLATFVNRIRFLESFSTDSDFLIVKIKNDLGKVIEYKIPYDKIVEITDNEKTFFIKNKDEVKIRYISEDDGAKDLYFNAYNDKDRIDLLSFWMNKNFA